MELYCKSVRCGWEGQPDFSMSGDHIKASCGRCGKYIKFVKLSEMNKDDLANLRKWQEKETETVSEYKRGFMDGIRCFAHWRDGDQYVGTCGMALKTALANVENLEGYNE